MTKLCSFNEPSFSQRFERHAERTASELSRFHWKSPAGLLHLERHTRSLLLDYYIWNAMLEVSCWTTTSGTPCSKSPAGLLHLERHTRSLLLDYYIWNAILEVSCWTTTSGTPCSKSTINSSQSLRRLSRWKLPCRPSGKSCQKNTSTRRGKLYHIGVSCGAGRVNSILNFYLISWWHLSHRPQYTDCHPKLTP